MLVSYVFHLSPTTVRTGSQILHSYSAPKILRVSNWHSEFHFLWELACATHRLQSTGIPVFGDAPSNEEDEKNT